MSAYDFENACEAGDISKVEEILEQGFTDVNIGLSPACAEGHRGIINMLISHGANDWNEGLCGAACGGHLDLVDFMINSGATILDDALALAKDVEVARLLVNRGANPTKGLQNAWNESMDKDMLIFLLNRGADMRKFTLLHSRSDGVLNEDE